jgi:beta-phosphoglucomutase-like phosphatase (HAD superfamily)
MKKEKIILTDADGVLVDWNTAFDKFMARHGHPRVPETDTEYNISLRHNVTTHQAMAYVKEFNESPDIAHLSPFADAVPHVRLLAELGFKFIVVTSISSHPDAKIHRTNNLTDLFGDVFEDIHCIEQGASKASILMNWADTGYFWIEDHMRQAEAGYEAGLRTILINHPYNFHYKTDLFPTVSYDTPWNEIYNMIRNEYRI